MVLNYTVSGDDMQIIELLLSKGEAVRCEVGSMVYMDPAISMETSTGGGLWKGFKRMLSGDHFFITTFTNTTSKKGQIAFGAAYPGKIIPLDLSKVQGEFLCQRDSFLCAEKSIDISMEFVKRFGVGFFGGEGFILQKLTGEGLVFLHAGGFVIKKELKKGEMLKVDTGCVVGFERSVDYNIQFVGGFKNSLFGGEGLFFVTLTGPGIVYLQSLPLSRLADRIVAASHKSSEEHKGVFGVLGDVISGDK